MQMVCSLCGHSTPLHTFTLQHKRHYRVTANSLLTMEGRVSNAPKKGKNFQKTWINPKKAKPESFGSKEFANELHGRRHFSQSPKVQSAIVDLQSSSPTNLLPTLERVREVLQAQHLNLTLRYFGRLQRWLEVLQLFEWMMEQGKTNGASYTTFITLMGKGHQPQKALECYHRILDKNTKLNVFVCNALLNCLISNKKVETAFSLFNQMKIEGLNPDCFTYSMLISACVNISNGYATARDFWESYRKSGLKTDVVIYGSLISVCASNGLDKEAESYFEEMKKEGFPPNEFHLSSLLNAYAAKGNHEKAEKVVGEMRASGLIPNKVVLTSLLKVYAKCGLFIKARSLFGKIDALGYATSETPYCIMIDGLVKHGEVREAQKIFEEMNAKGIRSDGYSYSALVAAHTKMGDIQEVKKLQEGMEKEKENFDLVTMNVLLKAYIKEGDMKLIMQTLKKMDTHKISPDEQTYGALLSYFCKEKLYRFAEGILKDMQARGYQIPKASCSTVIQGLAKSGQAMQGFKLYNQLKSSRNLLSSALHERMIDILLSERMLKDAYKVLKDNMEYISQVSIDKMVIEALKSGDVNMLINILKAYQSTGYKIDTKVVTVVTSHYYMKGRDKDLVQLLEWLGKQGYSLPDTVPKSLIGSIKAILKDKFPNKHAGFSSQERAL